MWQYVFLMLRRQPGKSALVSSGFLLAACALILLSATTQTTLVRGNQIISQNWRPTYDLVVLPPQAKLPTDQLVPADLIAGYGGGISVRQYDQVKNLAGVEVAAPIAYVGYVQMPVPQIYFSDHSFPTGYYQLDWTLTSFNGLHHIVELQERDMIYIVSGSDSTTPVRDSSTTSSQPSDVLATFGGQIDEEIDEEDTTPVPMSPNGTGTFLLAAIDPAAENQLVHLDKSITAGRMLTEQDTVHLDSRIPGNPFVYPGFNKPIPTNAIPMLLHRQLPGQITLNATLTLGCKMIPSASPVAVCFGMVTPGRTIFPYPAQGLSRTMSWIFPRHPLQQAYPMSLQRHLMAVQPMHSYQRGRKEERQRSAPSLPCTWSSQIMY